MSTPNVKFAVGSSAVFSTLLKDPNTLYFLQDTQEIYLGDKRYALGKDIQVSIVGSGDFVSDIQYDAINRTITVVKGSVSQSPELIQLLNEKVAEGVAESKTYTNEAVNNLIIEAGEQVRWQIEDGV